ncbi:hypothetical protein [Nitrosomonas sp. Nm166]|uniref:hypothetical protein n=1 Tax=Nitrosomonas sp. Nm166 TaxID=1881054 RepID=UPI001160BCFA|nr:hypothetical protein [Nitrosomonas sp. Nm166]
MKTADLTVDELQALIRKVVHEELRNIMTDPDKYLEITDEIKARLELSLDSSERITFQEVKDRLKLA